MVIFLASHMISFHKSSEMIYTVSLCLIYDQACIDRSYTKLDGSPNKEQEKISDFKNNVKLISNNYVWMGDDIEDMNLLEELSM